MNDILPILSKPPLHDDVVLIDGLARSGKKLTCRLTCWLEDMDFFQYIFWVERFSYLHLLGAIRTDVAVSNIQAAIDEAIYSRSIGRMMNTRLSDASSVLSSPEPELYQQRAREPDGSVAMEKVRTARRMMPFQTHYLMANPGPSMQAVRTLKMLHVSRHPIAIAEDWLRRGWGDRYGVDPIAFEVLVEKNGQTVPWFAAFSDDDYAAMKPSERCIANVIDLQAMNDSGFETLNGAEKARVYRFCFEDLLSSTDDMVTDIASFLGRKPRYDLGLVLEEQKLPNRGAAGPYDHELAKLMLTASEPFVARLAKASRAYEARWGLEPTMFPEYRNR
ncbi:MAG: hypothetical protein TEF_17290 [Rhizobiales bacterium NRL2]|jgi:hypothetical protein|nr:MAG: hypothetical protein TEF_17290 [Rhizobiales bacterium NRL2]